MIYNQLTSCVTFLSVFTYQKYMFIFSVCTVMVFSSCVNSRKVTYFNDVPTSEYRAVIGDLEPILEENDILSISVSSLNPSATEMFNVSNAAITQSSTAMGTTLQQSGYLIDQEGYIRFPFLGKIKAAGLTKKALREEITSRLVNQKFLIEPIVDVRYLNYKVSVLGEVGNPSVLTIPNEKVTLLEALGLAGDLTIYARRDNVLLIREEAGVKKLTRIDLTTDDLFTSPFYYLKSNDIIYVEPNNSKIASTSRTTQWLPIILSALSFGIIAIDRL